MPRVFVVVAAIAAMVGACGGSAGTSDDSTRDDTGRITEAGRVGTQALQVGDCFMEPVGGGSVLTVTGVPCTQPHDAQVIARIEMPDGDEYPGVDAVSEASSTLCIEAAGTVPQEKLGSGVGLSGYAPEERSWDAGDRDIVCFVEGTGGRLLEGDVFS